MIEEATCGHRKSIFTPKRVFARISIALFIELRAEFISGTVHDGEQMPMRFVSGTLSKQTQLSHEHQIKDESMYA